jgi:DNA-directed RNA polymerase specialized sigma24 family protein
LAYLGGLTHAEIATVQGAPLSTVKTRLALALPKLVTYVTAQGLTHEDALR